MFYFTLIFILKLYTALNYCILCLLCLLVSKYLYFIETKPFSCTVCEVNFTEIQSLVSHFDQYHAFEKRNEDHVNQKTESGGKKKCPHCSQQFSRLDTKHIKKCEKYSKYIEYGSNRFTCRLCTGSKKSRNRKHIYKLYSHIDEHLSKEVSKENEQSPSEANLDKTLLKTSPEETKSMESIISKRISKEGNPEYLVKWKNIASEFNSWEPEANIKDQSLLQEYTNGLYAKRLAKDKDLVALTPKSKKTKINENLNSAGDKRNVSESVDKTKDKCENCNQLFGKGFVDRHNKSGKCKLYSKYIEYGSKIAKCRLCTQSNTQMKNIGHLYSHLEKFHQSEISKDKKSEFQNRKETDSNNKSRNNKKKIKGSRFFTKDQKN